MSSAAAQEGLKLTEASHCSTSLLLANQIRDRTTAIGERTCAENTRKKSESNKS
jgi:hypothetical protein